MYYSCRIVNDIGKLFQDLSGLGMAILQMKSVGSLYVGYPKLKIFASLSGTNPDNYIVASCNPGILIKSNHKNT